MKLPDGWRIIPLNQVIHTLQAGVSVNSLDEEVQDLKQIGILKTSSVTTGRFDPRENKVVVQKDIGRVKTPVQGDRIILSRMNTPCLVGANTYVPQDHPNLFLPDRLWSLEPLDASICMRWLSFVLGSSEYRQKLSELATGTSNSMKNISKDAVMALEIPYPPLPEQRRIAEFLGTWDEAIEKLEQLIAAEEAVLNAYLSRFVSAYESQNIPLGKLDGVKIEKGRSVSKSLLTGGNIPVIAGGKTTPYYCSAYTHDGETVTISASGAYAGYVWYHSGKIWASDCNVLTSSAINVKFIFFALKYQQQRIYSLQSGGAQPHVYAKDIEKILIPMLPRDKQDEIVKILSLFEQKALMHRQELAALQKQKRGLMQKLLTGTWRV